MRGAPQSKFSVLICRIAILSRSAVNLPATRFPTPIAAKAGPMPTHQRFGANNHENRRIDGNQR